jgi:hypothetical protein
MAAVIDMSLNFHIKFFWSIELKIGRWSMKEDYIENDPKWGFNIRRHNFKKVTNEIAIFLS